MYGQGGKDPKRAIKTAITTSEEQSNALRPLRTRLQGKALAVRADEALLGETE